MGFVINQSFERVKFVYEQILDLKIVIVVGVCLIGGSVFYESLFINVLLDRVIFVDVYVFGCLLRFEVILYGVVFVLEKFVRMIKGEVLEEVGE